MEEDRWGLEPLSRFNLRFDFDAAGIEGGFPPTRAIGMIGDSSPIGIRERSATLRNVSSLNQPGGDQVSHMIRANPFGSIPTACAPRLVAWNQ
jgi:hypothetical protein